MANTITTFNTSPYYDDFSDDKNYHRVLFRPGLAVQARELTQLQTILQDQISKFGQHVFKEGSRVLDGQIFIRDTARAIKLNTRFGGNTLSTSTAANTVNITNFEGAYAYGLTSNTKHKVIKTQVIGGVPYVFTNLIESAGFSGNTYNPFSFANNEIIRFRNVSSNAIIGYANTATSNVSSSSLIVHVDSGVFFVKGHFVKAPAQSIVVSEKSTSPNASVGFTYNESIVSSATDSTLLDPAQGAYNYAAPGADRYKITLELSKITGNLTSSTLPDNYFELVRFEDGKARTPFNDPKYNKLMDTMAQRTFDESGHYTVRPFRVTVPRVTSNTANVNLSISPGRAYVKGYLVDYLTPTTLIVPKARETDSETGYDIGTYFGNYIKVSGISNGTFNLANTTQVQLHRVLNRGAITTGTAIGNAHVSYFQYDSGSGNTAIYNLFLHNINMKGNNQFSNVRSVILGTASSVTAFANVVWNATTGGIYSNGATKIFDDSYKKYIFTFPQKFISTVTSSEYETRRVFKNITFTNGKATLTTDSGNERFLGASSGSVPNPQRYYTVVIKSGGAAGPNNRFMNGKHVPLDVSPRYANVQVVSSGSPGQIIINLSNTSFSGVCDVVAGIDIENNTSGTPGRRTKTLVSNSTKLYRNISANTDYSLYKSDLYTVKAIWWTGSNTVNPKSTTTNVKNILSRFIVDNGQRDSHYDHGSLRLKVGSTVPAGLINVVFDYFTHSGKGYFSTNSYPIDYGNIPAYTSSDGQYIRLGDAYDFRPRRTDNTSNTTLIFDTGVQMPDYSASINSDYSYYLSRIDKVFLTGAGDFVYKQGIPSYVFPVPPPNIADAMLVATIKYDPFTLDSSSISVSNEDNRRYTMRDIGKLDARLSRVEYYTSLNLLEKDVKALTIRDSAGNDLFKNGILVDSFAGHSVGDVLNPQYRASIDGLSRYARPMFVSSAVDFTVDNLSSVTKSGDLITRPFTEKVLFNQNLCSNTENINPFDVFSWVGILKLTPDNDFWYDNEYAPLVQFNNNNAFDNWLAGLGHYSQWNDWEANWYGITVDRFTAQKQSAITSNYTGTSSSGLTTTAAKKSIQTSSGGLYNIVLNSSVIPYMRPRQIKFEIEAARPNTSLFCWFDGHILNHRIRVGSNTAPLGNTFLNLKTDNNGRANGYIDIPASNSSSIFKFTTGTKLVIFNDSPTSPKYSTTYAQSLYSAVGALNYVARASLKPPIINSEPDDEINVIVEEKTDTTKTNVTVIDQNDGTVTIKNDQNTVTVSNDKTVFIDSDISVAELAAILGLSAAETQTRIDTINAFYEASQGVMVMGERDSHGRNSETSLDVGGFIYWSEVYDEVSDYTVVENAISQIGNEFTQANEAGAGAAYVADSFENAKRFEQDQGLVDEFAAIRGVYENDVAAGALEDFEATTWNQPE